MGGAGRFLNVDAIAGGAALLLLGLLVALLLLAGLLRLRSLLLLLMILMTGFLAGLLGLTHLGNLVWLVGTIPLISATKKTLAGSHLLSRARELKHLIPGHYSCQEKTRRPLE